MISIIIPAHNENANLDELLPYLEHLNAPSGLMEVIVALSATSAPYPRETHLKGHFKIIRCAGNGRALQMNEGAENAEGEVLAFLHADVRPPLEFLHNIKEALDNEYDAGFFSYRFNSENKLLKVNASFTGKDGFFTGGGDQCLFIRKERFKELGRFDPEQVLMEDFEFFKRMKQRGVAYTIIKNDLLVSARKYEQNSYLKINLTNLILVVLFRLGTPARRLKGIHDFMLKTNYLKPIQASNE
ncbi:glycosyltransferase [Zeaxanthinibacter sp. PT1]|uniref:glycosyltransferase n=1 Tax=Zeaxanthinibacter TaxID=561554 RepID=UPI0023492218|nr:glycosyltransferase [Zeaxanthinibacter sp. PT1]MDC6352266.1 glycosyltransferase [Zeaxanthinibacter sp. PT1]